MTEVCDICGDPEIIWNDGECSYCERHMPILDDGPEPEPEPEPLPEPKPVVKPLPKLLLSEPKEPTERQLEVLQLYAWGLSLQEIADYLDLAYYTVRNHSYDLKERLGAANLTHALTIALECKFVTFDDLKPKE